jgi:hypothetical protein
MSNTRDRCVENKIGQDRLTDQRQPKEADWSNTKKNRSALPDLTWLRPDPRRIPVLSG